MPCRSYVKERQYALNRVDRSLVIMAVANRSAAAGQSRVLTLAFLALTRARHRQTREQRNELRLGRGARLAENAL